MLSRIFTQVAIWFGPIRNLLLGIAAIMLVMIVLQLTDNEGTSDSTQSLPYFLLVMLWLLFFYTIASAFQPSSVGANSKGFFSRLKQRIASFLSFLMTIIFVVLFFASCHVSIRFFNLIGV